MIKFSVDGKDFNLSPNEIEILYMAFEQPLISYIPEKTIRDHFGDYIPGMNI